MIILQDRDVDGLLSRLLNLEESTNADRTHFLKIFESIDKSGDGRCTRSELTVGNTAPLDVRAATLVTPSPNRSS